MGNTNDESDGGAFWARWVLGGQLRDAREKAGKTMEDVEMSGIASVTKLYRIENARTAIKPGDIWALGNLYGLTPQITEALAAKALATRGEGWYEEYASAVPDWLASLAGIEEVATKVCAFEPAVVFGLLQTADYARALIQIDTTLSEEVVESRVAFRLQRQEKVLRKGPAGRVQVVLGAGALELVVGSVDIMHAQINHLVKLNEQNLAQVRICPWSAGPYMSLKGPFTIMGFKPPNPAVVHVESYIGARYIGQPAQLRRFKGMFAELTQKSVPIKEFLS